MKWIKTYEELKPETYDSAADKLSKLGHKKRPSELKSWSDNIKKRNLIESIKTIGDFEIEVGTGSWGSKSYNDTKKVGQFYIYLNFDKDDLYNQMRDWKEHGTDCWLPLDIALYPINEESKKILDSFSEIYYNDKIGVYFVSRFWFNISQSYSVVSDKQLYDFGIKKPINIEDLKNDIFPTGLIDIDDTHDVSILFINRKNAIKFKKSLIDIFNGNVDYRSSNENPGGLRDEVLDELSDEYGLDIGQLLRFTDSLKKIRINSLYKD